MSKTPRTDKFLKNTRSLPSAEWGEKTRAFMRQLETELADKDRQLAEARAETERLKQELRDNSTQAARQIVPAEMLVDDLTAEIERKDALIEQMREALKRADDLLDEYASGKDYEHQDKEVRDMIKAALSAAEGASR